MSVDICLVLFFVISFTLSLISDPSVLYMYLEFAFFSFFPFLFFLSYSPPPVSFSSRPDKKVNCFIVGGLSRGEKRTLELGLGLGLNISLAP